MREIRMLRLMRQGMETWPMPWRHSLTLPEGGASGNRTFLPLSAYKPPFQGCGGCFHESDQVCPS